MGQSTLRVPSEPSCSHRKEWWHLKTAPMRQPTLGGGDMGMNTKLFSMKHSEDAFPGLQLMSV